MVQDHSLPGIKNHCHTSSVVKVIRFRVTVRVNKDSNVVGLSWILDRGQFFSFI